MTAESYDANYQSGLSFLKLAMKDEALDCFNRAYSQLTGEQKNPNNAVYFSILSHLAVLALEASDKETAKNFVDEGLKVKRNHADLLYLNALLLMDEMRYDEMMEGIVHYLLALEEGDAEDCHYQYAHPGALKELYENLLPTAYKGAFQAASIRNVVESLAQKTGNRGLQKAYEVMSDLDGCRSEREH
ncbi:MAG: hypothetical protein ACE5GK_00890 [Nitrospiria bacterium]